MPKKYFFILIFQLLLYPLMAQIPTGTFRTHLSGTTFHSIAVSPEYIYAASESQIMCLHKSDHHIHYYSKADGLSDALISQIYYDSSSRYLVVAYENGNLDFIKEGNLYNLSDIKDKNISGEKRVKEFYTHNGLLYLVYSFAIVSIDMDKMLIADTWYTMRNNENFTAHSFTCFNEQFYVSSNAGILYSSIDNPALADFSSWTLDNTLLDYDILCPFNHDLYAGKRGKDTLYYFHNNQWQKEERFAVTDLRYLKSTNDELLIGGWGYVDIINNQGNTIFYHYWDTPYSWADARDAQFDATTCWVADKNNGLIQISRTDWYSNTITGNGPRRNDAFRIDCSQNLVAMVPGSITSVWGSNYSQPYLNLFNDEKWSTFHTGNTPSLANVYDFADVAINPNNKNDYYVGSFHSGLFHFNQEELVQVFHHENSPLNSKDTSDAYIAGVTFDAASNLWISLSYAASPIAVLKNDGSWQMISLGTTIPSYNTAVDRILIDSRGWKWVPCPRAGKLVVLDDNHTISTLSDDRTFSVNMNANANIETSRVNCVVEDKTGQIWIGCDIGIKVIYNPGNIFNGNTYPQNILIEQNNHVQNLFEYDEITAIAVDDGNRKWIGTVQSGVFFISADGTKELLHFTEDNSPLLSNRITDICINRQTGEVFFATSNGLISYKGTATEGKEDYSETFVYPNPVRENYHGIITITGLMDHSFCKIADSAGTLVWQGYANGGTLVWNGKDFYGKRPATGVYFVFASDETGKQKNVSKILFIK